MLIFLDESTTIKIYNHQQEYNGNAFVEKSRRVSPEPNQAIWEDQELFSSIVQSEEPTTNIKIPDSRDNINKFNSPIRGSYSAKRIKRNNNESAHKPKNMSRNTHISLKKGYSASKNSAATLYMSGSRQSPTFRPNYQSSNMSRRSFKAPAPKPPAKRKVDQNIIGKDSNGNPIHSKFSSQSISIDFIDNKPKNFQRKRISLEDEEKTRQWLRKINFHSYLSDGQPDLMEDAVRNGILFWELLWFLENIQLYNICYKPKVIKDCRDNIDKAITVWEQIGRIRENIPPSLICERELILKGEHATVWGILNWLRKLYPDILPREHLAYLENTLPYTSAELIALEASLLNWIYGCGAFRNYKQPPTSLIEIEEDLRNGTIYCRLVQFIFNMKISGVFNDPKTESTKICNLRKAFEVLKKEKSMSQKYTWSEREIVKGDREQMFGLLEDMHILFDGFPPRQWGKNYFENGPHIGRVYDQMNRKPFFFQTKKKDDTFELDLESNESESKQAKTAIKDYIGNAKTENLRLNTTQEIEKGLNTDRPQRKHEEIPSIINKQMSIDLWSPIEKVKSKKHQFKISPIRKQDNGDYMSVEVPFSHKKHKIKESVLSHNNQMSSKPVSDIASPEPHTFLPHKRITEDSMDYTERSRTEELEELEDRMKQARINYATHIKNPFSINISKADIDPFKEFINRHKNKLKSSEDKEAFRNMYECEF